METKQIILAAVGAALLGVTLAGYIVAKRGGGAQPTKKQRRIRKLWFVGVLISAYLTAGSLITGLSGKRSELKIEFEMFSERVPLFAGITVAKTTVLGAALLVILTVLMLLFRFIAVPKFTEGSPGRLQNVFELIVETLDSFVGKATNPGMTPLLAPYMLSVALYMFASALTELFGLRAPISDLTFTFSLGLCTLALVNICGIRENGFGGRLRNMGGPVPWMRPIMVPLKMVSDFAVPISLACRLFGNMMGGMLVMELLKGVLGGFALGLPAVAGIYFNLIHPMLQIYIFVTLSLTYISEALE